MPGGTDRFVSTDSPFGAGPGTRVVCGCRVVFGTLLGPEATGLRGRSFGGGFAGLFVSGFLAWPLMHGLPLLGVVCGVRGLGLLFENYIVDASIFEKKQFPRIMNLDLAALLMPPCGVSGVWLVSVVLS